MGIGGQTIGPGISGSGSGTGGSTVVAQAFLNLSTLGTHTISVSGSSLAAVDSFTGSPGAHTIIVSIPAVAGDVIAVTFIMQVGNATTNATAVDIATVNGSYAPINYLSSGTATPATNGIVVWAISINNVSSVPGIPWLYTVQAGDVVSGNVTLVPYVNPQGNTRSMFTGAASPGELSVINYKH